MAESSRSVANWLFRRNSSPSMFQAVKDLFLSRPFSFLEEDPVPLSLPDQKKLPAGTTPEPAEKKGPNSYLELLHAPHGSGCFTYRRTSISVI